MMVSHDIANICKPCPGMVEDLAAHLATSDRPEIVAVESTGETWHPNPSKYNYFEDFKIFK